MLEKLVEFTSAINAGVGGKGSLNLAELVLLVMSMFVQPWTCSQLHCCWLVLAAESSRTVFAPHQITTFCHILNT